MTADEFIKKTGSKPVQDDLERVNCLKAGQMGHWSCGWCQECDTPQFECGCFVRKGISTEDSLAT